MKIGLPCLNILGKMRLQAVFIIGFYSFYTIWAQDLDVRCYSCGYVINPDGSKDADGEIPFCDDFATDSDMIVNAGPVSIDLRFLIVVENKN